MIPPTTTGTAGSPPPLPAPPRSEEHTSELQSRQYLPSFPTRPPSGRGGVASRAEAGALAPGLDDLPHEARDLEVLGREAPPGARLEQLARVRLGKDPPDDDGHRGLAAAVADAA